MSMSPTLVPHDHQHAIELLRAFFGDRARELYEANGRSLARLVAVARESTHTRMRLLARAHAIAEAAAVEAAAQRDVLSSPDAVTQFLKLRFMGQQVESFVIVFLDAANQLIAVDEMFRGTLTQTSVYPREVAKQALQHNAASIICSHCHPSGVCEPSSADEYLTQTLQRTLQLVDVRLLDHILIAGGSHMSFAQRGML
jgi:DNA repair protein RadC